MKKIGLTLIGIGLLVIIGIVLILKNDGSSSSQRNRQSVTGVVDHPAKSQRKRNEKVLIVYMSHTGHTKQVAQAIHRQIGGDLYQLTTQEKYPAKYQDMLKIARAEQEANQRPKIRGALPNLNQYRYIVLGYPIWLDKNPMAINTFLNHYPSFRGKTIFPFTTSGSSGLGSSLTELKANAKNAKFGKGLPITDSELDHTTSLVKQWAQATGL